MRSDTPSFKRLKSEKDKSKIVAVKEHSDYIDDTKSPSSETSEVMIRNYLESLYDNIKQWFMDEWDLQRTDFDHFPLMDDLIYNENGWTLHESIKKHYDDYNRHRDKERLKDKIAGIILTEADRLLNTFDDKAIEQNNLFQYVTITGEDRCGGCGVHYGTFRVGSKSYKLPPYHRDCGCIAYYSNNPDE